MFNFEIKYGITRIVILLYKYAVKLPNFKNGHLNFIHGCYCNYYERNYCKIMKGIENNKYYNLVAPSLYCSLFGIIQLQKRCIINNLELTNEQLSNFDYVRHGESKPCNFGYINNQLVCLDYAN